MICINQHSRRWKLYLHLQSFSKWPVWLLSSIWGLSSSQQRLCSFCYTQTVSVTCVQVTFSNGEKSAECGQNACSFSVPCDRNISAAVQGADLLRPPQKAARGKYTKAQKVPICTTPSFQPIPSHSSPHWMRPHKTAIMEQQEANSPGKFSLGINSTITSLLEHVSYSRPYCQLFIVAETSTISMITFRTLFLTQHHKQLSKIAALIQKGRGRPPCMLLPSLQRLGKCFTLARLLNRSVGHCYQYFTPPIPVLSLN